MNTVIAAMPAKNAQKFARETPKAILTTMNGAEGTLRISALARNVFLPMKWVKRPPVEPEKCFCACVRVR